MKISFDNDRCSHWLVGAALSWLLWYFIVGFALLHSLMHVPIGLITVFFLAIAVSTTAFVPSLFKARDKEGVDNIAVRRRVVTWMVLAIGFTMSLTGLASGVFDAKFTFFCLLATCLVFGALKISQSGLN